MRHTPFSTSHFSLLTLSLLTLLLTVSCDKVPMNGDLDGMWQLMSIQTPDGSVDTKARRVYVSFQLHLSQWNDYSKKHKYYAHFTHRGDSILFYDFVHPSAQQNKTQDDCLITPAEMNSGLLDAWGVHSIDARYRIDRLTDSSLILHDNDTVLTFRKF